MNDLMDEENIPLWIMELLLFLFHIIDKEM